MVKAVLRVATTDVEHCLLVQKDDLPYPVSMESLFEWFPWRWRMSAPSHPHRSPAGHWATVLCGAVWDHGPICKSFCKTGNQMCEFNLRWTSFVENSLEIHCLFYSSRGNNPASSHLHCIWSPSFKQNKTKTNKTTALWPTPAPPVQASS